MPLFASDPSAKPATDAQINFLEILFNDLGYNRAQKYARLSADLERTVKFMDELRVPEASAMIEVLKQEKDDQGRTHTGSRDYDDGDPWADDDIPF